MLNGNQGAKYIGQAHAVIEPGKKFQCGNSIKSQDTHVNTYCDQQQSI